MLLITAAPMDPPMVLILAFMPLATPVCSGGTPWTTRFDIAAKAMPNPTPCKTIATRISHWCWCAKVSRPKGATLMIAPATSTLLAPNRRVSRPDATPTANIATLDGSRISPEPVTLRPNP